MTEVPIKMNLPSFLKDPGLNLLLFGGKGGVGKTTCATAAALMLAEQFDRSSFLLVSTDPAHSLADSLAGFRAAANLKILEFEAEESFQKFKSRHIHHLREIASRGTFLDDEDINQFLDLSLPGMDEMMAFLEISNWVRERRYDRIIVDTAPTGHTLRLLGMPDLMGKWLQALDALLAKHRHLRSRFGHSGASDELDEFLEELGKSVEEAVALLRDPDRCRFVPVVLAEELSVQETVLLVKELRRLKVPVSDIVVNRLFPSNDCAMCAHGRRRQMEELRNVLKHFSALPVWGMPLHSAEVRGKQLNTFWESVAQLDASMISSLPAVEDLPVQVEAPARHPSPEMKLLVFAGKGGVGKTTLACATALRLAEELRGKEILLFSTDPAHSLSFCLDVKVGPLGAKIVPGLTAMEIDAQAEFEALKQAYRQELAGFLQSLLPNMDLTYDREVMEKILDLSPPGLDEIMALDLVMKFLAHGTYDVFVLDSAPTGHLVRLLELPELIDQWLKVFFGVFLKYKRIFRLPGISDRLIEMSRNLKQLRRLLTDPARSALYGVTILSVMAFEETQDLVRACRRTGLSVPVLFLNLVTSESPCLLCSSLRRHEQDLHRKFSETFPGIETTTVYRQGDLRGLEKLKKLGDAPFAVRAEGI